MIRLIILFFIPSLCFSQTSPIKAELIIFKDSFERFESFEYCMKFWNTSEDSIELHRLSQKTPILEIRELDSKSEWKELWKSGRNIAKDCEVWVNPGDIFHRGPPPPETYKLSGQYKYLSQKLVYYPVFEKNKTLEFKPNTSFEIRVKKDFGKNHGFVFSEPKIIFIKKDNLFNLDFIEDLKKIGVTTYTIYVPWELCGIKHEDTKIPLGSNDSLKYEILQLIEKHPNSDFYNWIQLQNSIPNYHEYNELEKILSFLEKQNRLIYNMLPNDFYPQCLLLDKLGGNHSERLGYIMTEQTWDDYDRIDKMKEKYQINCDCKN